MTFYLRTSLRAGPFRVSLSRSGIGMSVGVPGFRVGAGPRSNYVSMGAFGIRYTATLPRGRGVSQRGPAAAPGQPGASPFAPAPTSGVVMEDVTGLDATALQPTGPGDLVEQLNTAASRPLLWPWLAAGVVVLVVATLVVPPISLGLASLGAPAVVWFALWERARKTVVTFYEVEGAAAAWYDQLNSGYLAAASLGGAWRVVESGAISGTYQRKVNSGAAHLISRKPARFSTTPPTDLATNIAVPTVTCGSEAMLFLPDRILLRSGRRWSDLPYAELRTSAKHSRFIETGGLPHDGRVIDYTWQYVNVNGGPDRRFRNNRQLPIMLYGRLEFTSRSGLQWIVDCSRLDVADWLVAHLGRRASATAVSPPARTMPVTVAPQPARSPASVPFAGPGVDGGLFVYAQLLSRTPDLVPHAGPFAVIDVETTGLSPASGDRVIEIAVVRIDARGRIEDEYATLLNPDGRDTGPVFLHGISNDAVRDAPRFSDILSDLVRRLAGCVVVAHNAAFEARFLAAELDRARVNVGQVPALCTLWLGQQTFRTPNHKLHTLAKQAGIAMPDAHAALGDARAVAKLLPHMLDRYRDVLGYACAPLSTSGLRTVLPATFARPRTRAVALRKGDDGWMTSLLSRLPMSAAEAGGPEAERYLSCLSDALADGRIVGQEARSLADLAGRAGFGAAQVAELNQRFLESMREAAFVDAVLTDDELKALCTAALALGVPDYFDDLTPTGSGPASALGAPAAPVPRQRRCGHCRTPGHYRSRCPELATDS